MDERRRIAAAVRAACHEAARRAWEDAGISGLCAEGRWEVALEAVRLLDLDAVLHRLEADAPTDTPADAADPPPR